MAKIIRKLNMCILTFFPWCDLSADATLDATIDGDLDLNLNVDVDPIEVNGNLNIEPIGNLL